MLIEYVTVRQLSFPLIRPYKRSNSSSDVFDPYVIEVGAAGRSGWGECFVSEGYTTETRKDSWQAALTVSQRIAGLDIHQARGMVDQGTAQLPGIRSALHGALDMLTGHPMLDIGLPTRIPLLAPCQESEEAQLKMEIEHLLAEGYRTLKVKVGFDWQDDLARVMLIQRITAGRAQLRLDANRGYSVEAGTAFASQLHPNNIELLEQPCAADDWEANAAVASVSTVPVMMDESIYDERDIERSATMANVGFVKLKLKKMGRLDTLASALQRIRELGLTPVLGDGVSLEIACWMEACVAARLIDNAGEMNGFLKARERLFQNPLVVKEGAIHLPAGYTPRIDQRALADHTIAVQHFQLT